MRFSLDWLRDFVDVDLPPAALASTLTNAGLEVAGWEEIPATPRSASAGMLDGRPRPTPSASTDVVFEIEITANRPDAMNHLGLAREISALLDLPLHAPAITLVEDPEPVSYAASIAIEAGELCPRYVGRVVLDIRLAESPEWLKARLISIGLTPKNNIVDCANYVLFELGQPLHTFDLERLSGRGVVVRRSRAGERIVTVADRTEQVLAEGMLLIAEAGEAGRIGRPAAIAGVMGGLESAISDTTRHVLIESAWFDPLSVRRTARALGLHTDASHRFERGADPGMTLFAANRLAAMLGAMGGGRILSGALDVRPGQSGTTAASSASGSALTDVQVRSTITLATTWREKPIVLMPENVGKLLGVEADGNSTAKALARLEIRLAPTVALGERATFVEAQVYSIPTWRGDLVREVDLIEEYARLRGYDDIPETLPRIEPPPPLPSVSEREDKARTLLASIGYREAINYAMISPEDDRLFGASIGLAPAGSDAPSAPLRLVNPLSDRWEIMRRSLLSGLSRTLVFNLARGCESLRLFEVGAAYHLAGGGGRVEVAMAAIGATGLATGPAWPAHHRAYDLLDLKGALDGLVEAMSHKPASEARRLVFTPLGRGQAMSAASEGVSAPGVQTGAEARSGSAAQGPPGWPFHPGQSFLISWQGNAIGRGGRLHPDVERAIESDRPLFVAEISLAPFLAPLPPARYQTLPRLNPVERDLSFFVKTSIPYARVAGAVQAAVRSIEIAASAGAGSGPGLPSAEDVPDHLLVDRFQGGAVPEGMVSYAYRFRFAPRERALTADELNGTIERIAQHLVSEIGAEIRNR